MIEARLRRELEEAFANRAHLYRLLLDELGAELGAEAAERLLARVLERRGREVAAGLFAATPRGDARAVAERFLATSPDEGRLYPHTLEQEGDVVTVQVHRCPLQDTWRASGLDGERIAVLCRLAGAFDRGLFEAAGVAFAAETWRPGRAGCCRIRLARLGS
jgi:hypothetical protein